MLRLLLLAATCITSAPLTAQSGCTDPQASNYDPAATQNDGSCQYPNTAYLPALVTPLAASLAECSGLVRAADAWWTHNDGGNPAQVLRIDPTTGAIVQSVELAHATNHDWEDLGTDGTHLLIGDVGNNASGNRTDLGIFRVPLAGIGSESAVVIDSAAYEFWPFAYEDQTDFAPVSNENDLVFDCEALLYFEGKIHLFTKNWSTRSSTQYTLAAGSEVAERRETLLANGLVTGAAMSPDSQVVVLLGYETTGVPVVFMWILWDFEGDDFFSGHKRRIELGSALSVGQAEAIAFSGPRSGYLANERTAFGGITLAAQSLRAFDLSAWVPVGSSPAPVPPPTADWQVMPNPFGDFLGLKWPDALPPEAVRICDAWGRTWYATSQPTQRVATAHWPVGTYVVEWQRGAYRWAQRVVKQ
jgi:hypothetical protein